MMENEVSTHQVEHLHVNLLGPSFPRLPLWWWVGLCAPTHDMVALVYLIYI